HAPPVRDPEQAPVGDGPRRHGAARGHLQEPVHELVRTQSRSRAAAAAAAVGAAAAAVLAAAKEPGATDVPLLCELSLDTRARADRLSSRFMSTPPLFAVILKRDDSL